MKLILTHEHATVCFISSHDLLRGSYLPSKQARIWAGGECVESSGSSKHRQAFWRLNWGRALLYDFRAHGKGRPTQVFKVDLNSNNLFSVSLNLIFIFGSGQFKGLSFFCHFAFNIMRLKIKIRKKLKKIKRKIRKKMIKISLLSRISRFKNSFASFTHYQKWRMKWRIFSLWGRF